MSKTIFWSWQSDLDPRVTRAVIRFALDEAVAILAADLEEARRPSVTSDTQGVAGTPDIVATILQKIDEAAVFVGDVTPIAVSDGGKACANPNVLLEMGYANRSLTEHRVIHVWNTAFDGATLDKLPFDMRNRRGPLAFHLPVDADTSTLRTVRAKLASALAARLKLALDQLPQPIPDAINWQPHAEGDGDLWFDRNTVQIVTNTQSGSSKFRWKTQWPGYARIIPTNWAAKSDAKQLLADHPGHPALLRKVHISNYGVSRGGTTVYCPSAAEDGIDSPKAITQWFEKTGELWGIGGGFLFKSGGGRLTLAPGFIYKRWLNFLEKNCALALTHGGALPVHIRLGIHDLSDSWWPRGQFDSDDEGFAAVELSYELSATLTSIKPDALRAIAVAAFNGLADVYGKEPHTVEEIEALARQS